MSHAVSAQNSQVFISAVDATAETSPSTYIQIKEVKTFQRDGDRAEIDVTSMDSTAREFRLGLQDFGNLTMEMNGVFNDAGQQKLVTAVASPNAWNFKIVYPDGSIDTFQALVKHFNISGAVDDVLKRQAAIRLTGAVTTVVAP